MAPTDKRNGSTEMKAGEPPISKPHDSADSTAVRTGEPPIGMPPHLKTYKHYRGVRFLVGAATIALYVLACTSTAIALDESPGMPGWACLLHGWKGLFCLQIGWLGNFPFVAALFLLFMGEYRFARWPALAAFVIGATFFFWPRYLDPVGRGVRFGTIKPDIGLFLWLGSFLVLTIASFGLAWLTKSRRVHRD